MIVSTHVTLFGIHPTDHVCHSADDTAQSEAAKAIRAGREMP